MAADLHVHSALSPCADDNMTPRAIVLAAIAAELDLIAICDHNSTDNVAAVQAAARDFADDLFGVIAGIEITTAEEAHILGLFPNAEQAAAVAREVAAALPPAIPNLRGYGRQCVMNANGEVLRENGSMLSWASAFTVSQAVALIHEHEGLAIAAHVDRPSFSVISQLGFMPEDVVFDAIEISAAGMKKERGKVFSERGAAIVSCSDAHFLDNIGDARTVFRIESPEFSEVAMALTQTAGRRICHA